LGECVAKIDRGYFGAVLMPVSVVGLLEAPKVNYSLKLPLTLFVDSISLEN